MGPAAGSLLFNLEDDARGGVAGPHPQESSREAACASLQQVCARLKDFVRPPPGFGLQLLQDVRHFKRLHRPERDSAASCQDEELDVDVVELAAHLSELGYSVVVRSALGGIKHVGSNAAPGSCFRNLRHAFLYVRCEQRGSELEGVEFVVEPTFRAHFSIPQPTASYSVLLKSAPKEFVGTTAQLKPVVELLCTKMALSFEARGLCVPPWRRPAAILSKWLPINSKDTMLPAPAPAPAALLPQRLAEQRPPPWPEAGVGPWQPPEVWPGAPAQAEAAAPLSPEQDLIRLASQQLEALARHSQQHASPMQLTQALLHTQQLLLQQEEHQGQQWVVVPHPTPHGTSGQEDAAAAVPGAHAPPREPAQQQAPAGAGPHAHGADLQLPLLTSTSPQPQQPPQPQQALASQFHAPRALSSRMDTASREHEVLGGGSPPDGAERSSFSTVNLNKLGFVRHSEPFLRHYAGTASGPLGRPGAVSGRPPVSLLSAQLQLARESNGGSCPASPHTSEGGSGVPPPLSPPPTALGAPVPQPLPPHARQQQPEPVVISALRPTTPHQLPPAAAVPLVLPPQPPAFARLSVGLTLGPQQPLQQQQQQPSLWEQVINATAAAPLLLAGSAQRKPAAAAAASSVALPAETRTAPLHPLPAVVSAALGIQSVQTPGPPPGPPAMPAMVVALPGRGGSGEVHQPRVPAAVAPVNMACTSAHTTGEALVVRRMSLEGGGMATTQVVGPSGWALLSAAAASSSSEHACAAAANRVAQHAQRQWQLHGPASGCPGLAARGARDGPGGAGTAATVQAPVLDVLAPAWPGAPVIHKVRLSGALPPAGGQGHGTVLSTAATSCAGSAGSSGYSSHAGR